MADDPVWPDPFRLRISWPSLREKKKREERGGTMHWQRTNHGDIASVTHERPLIPLAFAACKRTSFD